MHRMPLRRKTSFIQIAARAVATLAFGAVLCVAAQAQPVPSDFPGETMRFLNAELPQMEVAVKERDRDYFEQAMRRIMAFSEAWGFKTTANPALAQYATCTDAVNDFVIVGSAA